MFRASVLHASLRPHRRMISGVIIYAAGRDGMECGGKRVGQIRIDE